MAYYEGISHSSVYTIVCSNLHLGSTDPPARLRVADSIDSLI
jgi:hypothetical protein